jgi:signal transduction histidine kinase/CheY-like chemotaxis protein
MKVGTRITLGFVVLGIFIITAIFLSARPLENDLKGIGGFRSEGLYSIQLLNSKLNGAVEESFAYVVSGDTHEKEEFLKWAEHFKQNPKEFFPIAEQTIGELGDTREKEERVLYEKITSGHIVLVKQAKIMFEEYEETGTVSNQVFQQYEESIDFITTALNKAVEIQKEEMEHLHRTALDKINRSEKIIYGVAFISLVLAIGLGFIVSKVISQGTLESANTALQAKIAEKEEAQEKVHNERQNLYNMLDSLPIAFHLQASDYTVPFANKVFRERFGEPQKKLCHELMHNRPQPCEVCTTFKVFDHGENETTIWGSKDGRTYITVCTPFTDIDGSPLVMEMALDITDQENAKEEAILARVEAEKSNRAKSEFLTRMSHELRTPMNAILGFSQLLEMDQEHPLKPVQQNNVQHILKAGEHLLELINEILDLSKIESGKISLSIKEVHTSPLISEVLELLQPLLDAKNLSVNAPPLGAPELVVKADRVRLKQVMLNLMHNAIKYNCYGGSIYLACKKPNDHEVQISVQDTGIGIHPKNIENIFKPFQRVDSDIDAIEGTGIGLTISQKLILLMRGSLDVESEEGQGSCFSITLPTGKNLPSPKKSEPAVWPELPSHKNQKKHFTVLYVEDNPANMELVATILFRHNVKLLQAPDASLGIELAKAHKPDLILMDINLPGIDGYEALNIIKTDPSIDSIPVIALSADSMASDIKKGLSAGFTEYISKPIHITPFLTTVNKYLV